MGPPIGSPLGRRLGRPLVGLLVGLLVGELLVGLLVDYPTLDNPTEPLPPSKYYSVKYCISQDPRNG